MTSGLFEKIEKINAQIGQQLANIQRALRGEGEFEVEQVQALSKLVGEMAPIMERAADLRTLGPEIASQLDLYKAQLRELQPALERANMMLLARKAQMEAGRGQLQAVAKWAAMLGQTR